MKVTIKLIAVLLLPLLLFAACSTGNNGNSTSKINIKFVDKKTGKTVAAATTLPPAGIETLALTVTPASTTAATVDGSAAVPGGAAATPASQSLSSTMMADMISKLGDWAFQTITMDDNKTYLFDITATDKSGVILYTGSVLQTMKPGANTVNINCSTYAAATSAASWSAKTAMPTARSRAASAQVDGKIYVIGGEGTASVPVNTLEAYDPATNTWTTLPPMPSARRYAAAVAYGSKIFVIGGEDTAAVPYATVELFDITLGSWQTLPAQFNMPTARARLSAVAHNGIIYAIGGTDPSGASPIATVERFDPNAAAAKWSTAPSLNTARARFSAVVRPNSTGGAVISVFGGDTATGATNTHETLTLTPTPATGWNTSTITLPGARTRHGSTIAGTTAYIIGGGDTSSTLSSAVWGADFASSSTPSFSTIAPALPTQRFYPVMESVDGRVYVIGGAVASGATFVASSSVEELTPAGAMPRVGKSTAINGLLTVAGAEFNGGSMLLVGQAVKDGPLFAQLLNVNNLTGSTPTALNITPVSAPNPSASVAAGFNTYLVVAAESTGLYISALNVTTPAGILNKVRIDDTVPANLTQDIAIAFGGNGFLVTWVDATNIVYGRFVDDNGNPTSAAFSIGSGNILGLSYGGGTYLVVTGSIIPVNSVQIVGTVVTPGIASAGASAVLLSTAGTNYSGNPAEYNGYEFNVAVTVGNGVDETLYAMPIRYNGTTLTKRNQITVAAPTTPTAKDSPHSAWDGFKWIVSWFEKDVSGNSVGYYRSLDSNGTLLGAKTAFTPSLAGSLAGGRVWWGGSLNSYLLGWGNGNGLSCAVLQP